MHQPTSRTTVTAAVSRAFPATTTGSTASHHRSVSADRDTTAQLVVTPRCTGRVYGIRCGRPSEHAGEHGRGSLRW